MSRHFSRNQTLHREAINAADDFATIGAAFLTNIPKVEITAEMENIALHGRFSSAAETVDVVLVVTDVDDELLGIADPVTLTAGAAKDEGNRFLSSFYVHPPFGGRYVRLAVKAPPGLGDVDLYVAGY